MVLPASCSKMGQLMRASMAWMSLWWMQVNGCRPHLIYSFGLGERGFCHHYLLPVCRKDLNWHIGIFWNRSYFCLFLFPGQQAMRNLFPGKQAILTWIHIPSP